MRPVFLLLASLLSALAQEQPPPSLRGIVRDITTGKPVPSLRVSVQGFGQSPQSTVTNEKGEFQFTSGLRPGQFIIDVHSLEFVPSSREVRLGVIDDSGRSPDITVNVAPPASIGGRVMTTDGIPIAGAAVDCGLLIRSRGDAIANEQGEFEIKGLSAGECTLRARIPTPWRARGLPPMAVSSARKVEAGSRQSGIVITVPAVPLASFDGQVLDRDGKPLTDREPPVVEFTLLDPDSWMPKEVASLDAQGRFRLQYLPPGRYRMSVRRAGPMSQPSLLTELEIPSGGISGRQFTLSGRANLSGRITTPIPAGLRFTVMLHPTPRGPGYASAQVRPDGSFEFRDIPPGRWTAGVSTGTTLGVEASGFWMAENFTHPGRTGKHGIELELVDGDNGSLEIGLAQLYSVGGSVVDAEGRPVSGVGVQLFRDNPMLTFPRPDGTFSLHLAPGTYKVNALRGARPLPTFQDCPTTQTIEVRGNISGLKIPICP